jgi:DNA-binding HxlR family transcriptional regulator
MRWNKLEEEACSVARTVSVIGDRWTLLILRDCFLRVRRFEEFQARLGITRPLLASRLRKLVKDFVLAKVPYQQRPLRYEYRLTEKGLDLYPSSWRSFTGATCTWPARKGARCSTSTPVAARPSTP